MAVNARVTSPQPGVFAARLRTELARVQRRDLNDAFNRGVRVSKANAPVKTGRLRDSIGGVVLPDRIIIEGGVPYARLQNATHRTKSRFFEKGYSAMIRLLRSRGYR